MGLLHSVLFDDNDVKTVVISDVKPEVKTAKDWIRLGEGVYLIEVKYHNSCCSWVLLFESGTTQVRATLDQKTLQLHINGQPESLSKDTQWDAKTRIYKLSNEQPPAVGFPEWTRKRLVDFHAKLFKREELPPEGEPWDSDKKCYAETIDDVLTKCQIFNDTVLYWLVKETKETPFGFIAPQIQAEFQMYARNEKITPSLASERLWLQHLAKFWKDPSKRCLFMPISICGHWCLFFIDKLVTGAVLHLDSLCEAECGAVRHLLHPMGRALKTLRGGDWEVVHCSVSKQRDAKHCGWFVLYFISMIRQYYLVDKARCAQSLCEVQTNADLARLKSIVQKEIQTTGALLIHKYTA